MPNSSDRLEAAIERFCAHLSAENKAAGTVDLGLRTFAFCSVFELVDMKPGPTMAGNPTG